MTWQSQPVPPPHSGQQPPPHSDQQPPPDFDPSDEEQEDCDIGQHLELAMKFGEELGHVQTIMEY